MTLKYDRHWSIAGLRVAKRFALTLFGILLFWQCLVLVTNVPKFILPTPMDVLSALIEYWQLLLSNAGVTLIEIILGMLFGSLLGLLSALLLVMSLQARRWLLPIMVITQALPVFALAPLLTLWLGYGLSPKIVMATLITFFPVAAACYDGLRYTDSALLDLVKTMQASAFSILIHIRLPAAMTSFASGIRVAASVAPIGAIVGEWVGASHGLGYLMLHANGRMQTDLMFAALFVLSLMALALYFFTHWALNKVIYWRDSDYSNF